MNYLPKAFGVKVCEAGQEGERVEQLLGIRIGFKSHEKTQIYQAQLQFLAYDLHHTYSLALSHAVAQIAFCLVEFAMAVLSHWRESDESALDDRIMLGLTFVRNGKSTPNLSSSGFPNKVSLFASMCF